MTFRTKDAARKILVKLGVPSGLAAIGLHLVSKREEHRLAPPPEHVPHGEYQVIPPSFIDLRAGGSAGSTNRSDFPIGGRIDSNDVAIRWHRASAQHQTHVAQISSTLYMST